MFCFEFRFSSSSEEALIEKLNDDILLQIFSFLELKERILIERGKRNGLIKPAYHVIACNRSKMMLPEKIVIVSTNDFQIHDECGTEAKCSY